MSEYFIYGYLLGLAIGAFFGVLIRRHHTKDYIYKAEDIKQAYKQGVNDGREDKMYGVVIPLKDLSH